MVEPCDPAAYPNSFSAIGICQVTLSKLNCASRVLQVIYCQLGH